MDARGRVRVHRELVAALQVLRDRIGDGIKIESMAPVSDLGTNLHGQFAWISSTSFEVLTASTTDMVANEDWLVVAQPIGRRLYVQMPDPK